MMLGFLSWGAKPRSFLEKLPRAVKLQRGRGLAALLEDERHRWQVGPVTLCGGMAVPIRKANSKRHLHGWSWMVQMVRGLYAIGPTWTVHNWPTLPVSRDPMRFGQFSSRLIRLTDMAWICIDYCILFCVYIHIYTCVCVCDVVSCWEDLGSRRTQPYQKNPKANISTRPSPIHKVPA